VSDDALSRARDALREHFGFPDFRRGQDRAVSAVLTGRDTLVVLPTGGGKSVCYQVPALLLPGLTVVVSPLISLMKDQVDALQARGLPATFVNSTLSAAQVSDRLARAHRGEIKLLYLAPERFDAGAAAERLRAANVSLLAVDEAHCISEWGHDFRPSYLRMREVRERLGAPPTVALTATATPEVRRDIVAQLALRDAVTIVTGFDRRNLTYAVVPAGTEQEKDEALVGALRARDGLAVVYASTRKAVERISGVLERARIPAAGYHAGLDDAHRHEVQDAFMSEQVRAIVATNAFGMGIDKPNVRLVVHHAMPGTLEAYYQEAGRAGRDGQPSECVLLHAFPDRFTHEFFIKSAHPEREVVAQVYRILSKHARKGGLVTLQPDEIAALLPGKVSLRAVESSLRLLERGKVLATESESTTRVFVRLLATTDRVRRELDEERDAGELGLLRALWRAVGRRMQEGALVDLDGLPPGIGGRSVAIPLMDALQDRQMLLWERTGGGLRLFAPGSPLDAFPVDWDALERRRRADLAKLDAMQQYAYTTSCRRAFVLRYFGDESAGAECAGCDNCLGTAKRAVRGARPVKERAKRTRAGRRDQPQAVPPSAEALDAADARLFAALRTLRGEIAKEEQVPAYVVFTDRTLAELATRRPRSLIGFGSVHGVGPARLARYGERFLEIIRSAATADAG
jgi:ATP-dependent DNA helicase RecQ